MIPFDKEQIDFIFKVFEGPIEEARHYKQQRFMDSQGKEGLFIIGPEQEDWEIYLYRIREKLRLQRL